MSWRMASPTDDDLATPQLNYKLIPKSSEYRKRQNPIYV